MRQSVRLVRLVKLVGLVGLVALVGPSAGLEERGGGATRGYERGGAFVLKDPGRCAWVKIGQGPQSDRPAPLFRNSGIPTRLADPVPLQQIDSFPSPDTLPWGLAWDGIYLWHSDLRARTVYQLDASNGSIINQFPAPDDWTKDLTWDGTYLWACGNFNSRVYQVDPSTGSVVFWFSSPGINPLGLAWDGTYLWHSSHPGTDTEPTRIYKIDPSNGQVIALFPLPFQWANGLAWHSGFLWVSDSDHGVIYKLDTLSCFIVDACGSPGNSPLGLTYDNTYIWNTDRYRDWIYKFRPDSARPAVVLNLPEAFRTFPTWESICVFGTVASPNLVSWAAQYGRGESPTTWNLVDSVHHSGVVYDTLGVWDVSSVEQDFYNLRIRGEFVGGIVDTGEVVKIYVDPFIKHGWPRAYPNVSPVAFGDLDDDNQVEIVAGIEHNNGVYARVAVWDIAGGELWQSISGIANTHTPVALGNADNSGTWEIATGYPPSSPGDSSVPVYLLTYAEGICPNWPQYGKWETGFWAYMIPVFEDVDEDTNLEILIGGKRLYGWHHTGTEIAGWPMDFVASDPAVGDIDGDSLVDFVFKNQSRLEVRDTNGNPLLGFPLSLPAPGRWTHPVLGDVNNDGATEIIFALENTGLYVVDTTGSIVTGWPQFLTGSYTNSPVLGDLDGNGDLEIVVVSGSFPNYSVVNVFNHDGSAYPGTWPITLNGYVFRDFNAPVIADVNGDGSADILMGFEVEPEFEEFFAWDRNGVTLPGWPRRLSGVYGYGITGSPMVGDMDGDGFVDLALSSNAYWVANTEIYVWGLPYPYDPSTMEWPTYRHDLYRTANYHFRPPTGVVEGGESLHPQTGIRLALYPAVSGGRVYIACQIPESSRSTHASLSVYDLAGRLVQRFTNLKPGWQRIAWDFSSRDGTRVPQGVYLVILRAAPFTERAKLIHVRDD